MPFVSLTRHFDAFEDLPWALVYQDMASVYPNAKFILTLRENEKDWLKSIRDHTARRSWVGHKVVYGASQAEGHEESYLEAYRNHTSAVRSFFGGRENETRLLEWVIDGIQLTEKPEEEKWAVLLRFLEINDSEELKKELGDFPWKNRTDSWKGKVFLINMWWTWDKIMWYLEEVLLRVFGYLGWLAGIRAMT